jgi:hypothetical protein
MLLSVRVTVHRHEGYGKTFNPGTAGKSHNPIRTASTTVSILVGILAAFRAKPLDSGERNKRTEFIKTEACPKVHCDGLQMTIARRDQMAVKLESRVQVYSR